eukprot:7040631-Pyramimonas_sp.AAC.1
MKRRPFVVHDESVDDVQVVVFHKVPTPKCIVVVGIVVVEADVAHAWGVIGPECSVAVAQHDGRRPLGA